MTITVEINAVTGEEVSREMTTAEQKIQDAYVKVQSDKEAAKQAEAEANATAKAELLARLGITADEAKLLLGGN
jgi:phage-related tail fiber protein